MRGRSKTHRGNNRQRTAHSVYDKPDAMTSSFGPDLRNIAGYPCDRQNARAVAAESARLSEPRSPVITLRRDDGKLHTQRTD